ncbi:MAG: YraN family protein [bacterium]
MSKTRINTGRWGERKAAEYLTSIGYKIEESNFRCNLGEIDIIGWDEDVLVFIEVKTRKTDTFGDALESINYWKRRKISRVAMYFIKKKNLDYMNCRFDVITVINNNNQIKINLYKDAFQFV